MIAARAVGATIPLQTAIPTTREKSRGTATRTEDLEPTAEEVETAFARSAMAVALRRVPAADIVPGTARRRATFGRSAVAGSLA